MHSLNKGSSVSKWFRKSPVSKTINMEISVPVAKHSLPETSPFLHLMPKPNGPAKKRSKWTLKEDGLIIELQGKENKAENISMQLQSRSKLSRQIRYVG